MGVSTNIEAPWRSGATASPYYSPGAVCGGMAQAAGRARDTQPALFSCILSPAAAFSCTPQPPSSDVAPLLSPPSVWQKGSLFRATPRQNPAFFREKRQNGPFFRGKTQNELGIIGVFVRNAVQLTKRPASPSSPPSGCAHAEGQQKAPRGRGACERGFASGSGAGRSRRGRHLA